MVEEISVRKKIENVFVDVYRVIVEKEVLL